MKKKKSALCFRLSEAFGCGLYWNWVHSQHVEALILVFLLHHENGDFSILMKDIDIGVVDVHPVFG
jgi:hypothetical protein